MRIGIQTWGSDGDIRPLAALAGGLSKAGHAVTLALTSVDNKNYTALSEALSFKIRHIGSSVLDQETCRQIGSQVISERNTIKQLKIVLTTLFDPLVEEMSEAAKRLCEENDIVIGHLLVYPLGIAAEKAQRPYISVTLAEDSIPSKYRVPFGLPDLGPFMNTLWWKLGGMMMNRLLKEKVNALRRQAGLSPVRNIVGETTESRFLNLIAVSPSICQPRPDWGSHHHICGFFNVPDTAEPWKMPDDLRHFLDSGPAPVYMTFGSMLSADPDPEQATRIMVDAARLAGCRAIIQSKWKEITGIPECPDIYRIIQAPHQHLFPHCAAVVHHGGSGTTQSATFHGRPSVVVEHILDQGSWGTALKSIGIAPGLLHRRSLTAGKLARQIKTVLTSPEMAEKARRLGENMRSEDGVSRAVQLIEQSCSRFFAAQAFYPSPVIFTPPITNIPHIPRTPCIPCTPHTHHTPHDAPLPCRDASCQGANEPELEPCGEKNQGRFRHS